MRYPSCSIPRLSTDFGRTEHDSSGRHRACAPRKRTFLVIVAVRTQYTYCRKCLCCSSPVSSGACHTAQLLGSSLGIHRSLMVRYRKCMSRQTFLRVKPSLSNDIVRFDSLFGPTSDKPWSLFCPNICFTARIDCKKREDVH